ncbi:hypothetical protein [Sorangium sp. So ce388]|uniref:hypothetical protein n=1 Tax=Sorangium sp. So ce388 TaxID=3133309 RepID=UPI003F5AFDC7
MGSELKTEVPQLFESGARVVWDNAPGAPRVLGAIRDGWWSGWDDDHAIDRIFEAAHPPENLRVVAPAPRPGQMWTSAGGAPVPLKAAADKSWDAVAIARVFLENGFEYSGETSEPVPAPPPITSLEPLAPPRSPAEPTPWTREESRRAILHAIRSEAPLHREAFTSALCAMAEFFVPGERMILVTASALHAGEEALPERGSIAAWQEELGARAMREVLERAFGKGNAPMLCVDACARYLERRAAC